MERADRLVAIAGRYLDRGQLRRADRGYAAAAQARPNWSVPWYNRGFVAKLERRWTASLDFNRRAAELDPEDQASWWNLGIAATATGDWASARLAWSRCGVQIPEGSGPLEMRLGSVPIRVSPETNPEVVWCDRIDPARGIIRNVPFPECGRGFGDLVLHDGAANGSRMRDGVEIPVFDELELLQPGTLPTYGVDVVAPDERAAAELEGMAVSFDDLNIEDWTGSVRVLCKACSEGKVDDPCSHSQASATWQANRRFGIAARSSFIAATLLRDWSEAGPHREVGEIDCVLER